MVVDSRTIYIPIKKLHPDVEIPSFATPDSAGMDIKAYFPKEWINREFSIHPGWVVLIKTGFQIAIPSGYEGQIRSRSSLALKHQVIVLNSPGTIDADFRSEVGVILMNLSTETYKIDHGDRIAQLVIQALPSVILVLTDTLDETNRKGGFGSTGT